MKLKEIIRRIDRTGASVDIDTAELAELFGLNTSFMTDHDEHRLVAFYIVCMGPNIGTKVYFLDDLVVAIGIKESRYGKESFRFVSKERYLALKRYIQSLIPEDNIPTEFLDMDEEITPTYKIAYCSQLYPHHKQNAIYKGRHFTIDECIEKPEPYGDDMVKLVPKDPDIRYIQIFQEHVKLTDVDFPYMINQ